MPLTTTRTVLLLADDLSGAAETSAAFARSGVGGFDVLLWPHLPGQLLSASLCIDLDSRGQKPAAARRRVAEVLRRVPAGTLLFEKVDSLLRGNVAAELAAVGASGRGMIVAVAVPRESRSVRDGVVHVGEVRLTHSGILGVERATRDRVADVLGAMRTRQIPLDHVRAEGLENLLISALDDGDAAICDASTDDDLDRIAHAIMSIAQRRPIAAVGASGLARSLGRLLVTEDADASDSDVDAALRAHLDPGLKRARRTTLCVIGSRSVKARVQVAALQLSGVTHVVAGRRDARDPFALSGRIRHALAEGTSMLTLAHDERWKPAETMLVASAIAAVADETRANLDLVLIGGATARQVLDALGIDRIVPVRELASGTILCATARGHRVVVRPGSFGADSALVELVETLRERETAQSTEPNEHKRTP